MSITVDIWPEVEAELARQAAAQGSAIEAYAARLLEAAADVPQEKLPRPTGQALIDAFAEIRGLLTNEEIDRMFNRYPSGARPVDLSCGNVRNQM